MGQLYNEAWEHVDIEAFREGIISNGVLSGLSVSESTTPAMTVLVASGTCLVDATVYTESSSMNLNVSNGHATYNRKDIVVYDTSAGNPAVVEGTAAASPAPADIPDGDILLAIIFVEANETTSIVNADITDDRVYTKQRSAYRSVSADTTLVEGDEYMTVDATGANKTITLPAVEIGKIYTVKKIDSSANTVTLDGNGAETIDGSTTVVLTEQYENITVIGGSTEWSKISAAGKTNNEIRDSVEAATDSNTFNDADHTKLNGIEANATGDQSNTEIRTAVGAATDSNIFTDALKLKLDNL